jgi:xanthine dehydrogenase YagS FAD-binding subunit
MKAFEYVTAQTLDGALAALSEKPGQTRVKAGGIDLLDEMKERLVSPERIVHIRGIGELQGMSEGPDGSLRVGALVTLAEIGSSDLMKKYPAVAGAANDAASPAIRNVATLGGNLCQRPRCWYYRGANFPCLKKGGDTCFAIDGVNRYHAVLEWESCPIVHPSNLAPALMAHDGVVLVKGPKSERNVPLDDFFVLPEDRMDRETVLEPGELVIGVRLANSAGSRSAYRELREKQSFDWALVSCAARVELDGNRVKDCRVILGAVAPVPLRSRAAEQVLKGQPLTPETATAAAAAAFANAKPLSQNAFKVDLGRVLVRDVLLELAKGA